MNENLEKQITQVKIATEEERREAFTLEEHLENGNLELSPEMRAQGYLAYNSGSSKTVYSSSTGTASVGALGTKECCAILSTVGSRYQIKFLKPNGTFDIGYVTTSNMTYWRDKYIGGFMSNDKRGSNFQVVSYNVKKTCRVFTGDTQQYFDVAPGHLVLCKAGIQGKTGDKYKHLMVINGVRYFLSSGPKDELIHNLSNWKGDAGYANTNIHATSSSPAIRGNW